jgi:hypothetical protein
VKESNAVDQWAANIKERPQTIDHGPLRTDYGAHILIFALTLKRRKYSSECPMIQDSKYVPAPLLKVFHNADTNPKKSSPSI